MSPLNVAMLINPPIMDTFRHSCLWHTQRHTLQGVRHVFIACIITILSGGCASNYGPRLDLSSVETIGVYLPEDSSEPLEAENFIRLYNHDRVYKLDPTTEESSGKDIAAGAGTGAAIGLVAGSAALCLVTGCGDVVAIVILLPLFAGTGALAGGTIGGAAGATAYYTQEQVEVAPFYRNEANKVLPSLQRDYLTKPHLEERVLRHVRQQKPTINFAPAIRDGDRYRFRTPRQDGAPYTDVNLALTELRILLTGVAADDPRVGLTVSTQWKLTKYDAASNRAITWDILSGSYGSKRHPLSEWLVNEGALLKIHVNKGLDESLIGALWANSKKEDWPVLSTEDSF